jgi:chromosome segregation ATPase
MADKPPKLYDLHKTTIWFSIASVVLFVGLAVMVLEDSNREWKGWQRKFMKLAREKAEGELGKAEKSVDEKRLETLKKELGESRGATEGHKGEMEKIRGEMGQMEIEITKVKTRYQDLKQEQDSDRYFFEEYRAHAEKEKAEKYEKRLGERGPQLEKTKLEWEALEAARDEKQKALEGFTAAQENLEQEIKKALREVETFEKKVKKLAPHWFKEILNAPFGQRKQYF